MWRNFLACLLAVLCVSGMAQAQTESAGDYALAPGDRDEIHVLEDPSLNRQALVRPDGKISMPLAGTIEVAGRTPEEVQSLIRQRLTKDFIEPPTVTVSLLTVGIDEEELLLPAFYVLGEVARPGRYTFSEEKPVTVLQALSLAGGLAVFAARKRIQIRRYGADSGALHLFNYKAVESGKELPPPFFIEDGDIILVPERGIIE
jgi:polysaccharide export outer membrane protein